MSKQITSAELLARRNNRFHTERALASEAARSTMLALYRTGHTHREVAKAMDISIQTVTREMAIDAGWKQQVQEAMSSSFTPVYEHAQKLALQMDAEGGNAGSVEAMKLVFKFYSRVLDREMQRDIVERKIEATAEVLDKAAMIPTLTSPAQVAALLAELAKGSMPTVDGEVIEDAED